MTAPDSRDSVAIEFFHEADKLASSMAGIPAGPTRTALESEIVTLRKCAQRLQAIARGPQQAGGEDVQRWRLNPGGGIFTEQGGEYVEYTDYAALQAEVVRLNEQAEQLRGMYRNACKELALANTRFGMEAARLDWLIENRHLFTACSGQWFAVAGASELVQRDTARAAIDAAIGGTGDA